MRRILLVAAVLMSGGIALAVDNSFQPQLGYVLQPTESVTGDGGYVTADGGADAGIGGQAAFALTHIPLPTASLHIYKNGSRLKLTTDYTLSGKTVTFVVVPLTTDTIEAEYHFKY
jgi:hypothetical protein